MTTHTEHDEGASAAGTGYEPTDVKPKPVAASGLFLVLLMAFGFLGGWFFYEQFQAIEAASRPAVSPIYERHIPGGPLLQAKPGQTWQQYERNQREFLGSFGWVDEQRGVARVPVEVAIDRVVERGALPDFKAAGAAGTASAGEGEGTP